MRIAFDWDDTLVAGRRSLHAVEPCGLAWLGGERLRVGIVELWSWLRERGDEVWIYTTSTRSSLWIRWTLLLHGLWPAGVINYDRHEATIRPESRRIRHLAKYPPMFKIQLLIDDSEGVALDGRRHGFQVVVIDPDDHRWTLAVRRAVEARARGGDGPIA